MSKDNELRVWSTSSWSCVHSAGLSSSLSSSSSSSSSSPLLSDAFGCGLYKQARWAPDGSHLCLTHAVYVGFHVSTVGQTRFPAALLLSRESFAPQAVFAGHGAIVGVARFAPTLLQHSPRFLSLLALGSDDGTVSVWRTDRAQPIAVIRGASRNGVTDITWSRDAARLMFTAGETCVAVEFAPEELGGNALGGEEMRDWLRRSSLAAKKKLSMLPPKKNNGTAGIEPMNETPAKPEKTAEITPSPIPAVPVVPVIPPIPAVPVVPVIPVVSPVSPVSAPRLVPPRDSKKRGEADETPDPFPREPEKPRESKKRKKAAPPAEPAPLPAVAPRREFPAGHRSLPFSQSVPGVSSLTVSFQAFSLQPAPLSDETPDGETATLLQALRPAGNLAWSWLGQGRVVLAGTTSHHVVCVTRGGLMHVVSLDGITEIPAVCIGGIPAGLDVARKGETEIIAVMTTDARLQVWKLGNHKVETVETQDCGWLLREEVSRGTIGLVGVSQVRVTITARTAVRSFILDLAGHCWFAGEQPLLAYSAFAREVPARSLASPMASNAMFTVEAEDACDADINLVHRGGDGFVLREVRAGECERVREAAGRLRAID